MTQPTGSNRARSPARSRRRRCRQAAGRHRFRASPASRRRSALGRPTRRLAREDGGRDTVLLQDDVTLDRRGCLVFAQFLDAVGPRGARAEDLEHHDRFADDGFVWGEPGCNRQRRPDSGCGPSPRFSAWDHEPGTASPQLVSQQGAEGAADGLMRIGPAGHGDRLPPIKFVAQRLAVLPRRGTVRASWAGGEHCSWRQLNTKRGNLTDQRDREGTNESHCRGFDRELCQQYPRIISRGRRHLLGLIV